MSSRSFAILVAFIFLMQKYVCMQQNHLMKRIFVLPLTVDLSSFAFFKLSFASHILNLFLRS